MNHYIWLDILAYKWLQNKCRIHPLFVYECPIAITRHNNESVLFNRTNHFHGLRFLAQKQNFRTQAPRVLKTTVFLFWAWINKNYLKNVKTIKTMTLNDMLQMTLWDIISAKRDFWNSYALRIIYKNPVLFCVRLTKF